MRRIEIFAPRTRWRLSLRHDMTITPPPRKSGVILPRLPVCATVDGVARPASQIKGLLHAENRQAQAVRRSVSLEPPPAAVAGVTSQHKGVQRDLSRPAASALHP